jgi:hypothetical protein
LETNALAYFGVTSVTKKKVLKIAINLGRSVLALSISDNIDYSNGATTLDRKPVGRQTTLMISLST